MMPTLQAKKPLHILYWEIIRVKRFDADNEEQNMGQRDKTNVK